LSALFQCHDVFFEYEQIPALSRLSLEIGAGESVAIMGANGSGKSTLLHLLDGLCFPSRGSVSFCGTALTANLLQSDAFALPFRRRVALVFQNPEVQLFNPTVFDEVAFGPAQLQWPKREIVDRVDDALRLMRIEHLRDRPPFRLSSGEKQRVALASVIVLDPDVLLLDEPTASLDPRSQSELIDLIQNWKSASKTIIAATHQIEIVEDIAHRVFVMENGRAIASGAAREVLADFDLLLRANLVHEHRHSHGNLTHSHPHRHAHSDHEHEH
jgi:cobalt/nickel transport system ATP-binding protein